MQKPVIAIGSHVKIIELNDSGEVIKIKFDSEKNIAHYTLRVSKDVSENQVMICKPDQIELV